MNYDVLLHRIKRRLQVILTSSLRRYAVEIILIMTAGIITIISIQQSYETPQRAYEVQENPSTELPPVQEIGSTLPSVFVDVSGAVNKPGVYEATAGARITDMIEMAGGISHEADQFFVARNFNMARMVGDQDKIYIPYSWDIALGTFTEEKRILEYLNPLYPGETAKPYEAKTSTQQDESNQSGVKLSLNNASKEELDTLPGVGPVTAQKIVDNRPYLITEELITKKVMNQSTFDKIADFISL